MLFLTQKHLVTVLALGSLLTISPTHAFLGDHAKAAGAVGAGLATLFVLKHKVDPAAKNKHVVTKALDTVSTHANKAVNLVGDNPKAFVAAAVVAFLAYHGAHVHHSTLAHHVHHLLTGSHQVKP